MQRENEATVPKARVREEGGCDVGTAAGKPEHDMRCSQQKKQRAARQYFTNTLGTRQRRM